MRRSEFERAVAEEFGPRASSLLADLILTAVGGRTAAEAMAAGIPPRDIWDALCVEADVPAERRYGVGRLDPKK
ncbi:DUF3046 domain-containing protein [Microbacterium aureliae]